MIINCTPHALTIEGMGTIQPSGSIPRCTTVREELPGINGIRVVSQITGNVTGLPDAIDGTIYIVSGMVLAALNGVRLDVFAPDTGSDAIRENGQIVAVRGLIK